MCSGLVLAKTSVFHDGGGQFGVAHPFNVCPREHPIGILQADLPGNRRSGPGMITGDHFHPDARPVAFGDGVDRLSPRRVDQANEPKQHQLPVDIRGVQNDLILWNVPHCKRDHALTLRGNGLHLTGPIVRIKRPLAAIGHPLTGAHSENAFRRTLHVDLGVARVVVMEHGHDSAWRHQKG